MTDSANTVLITGNQGYIGAELTRYLRDRSYGVVGLDTMYYTECHGSSNAVGATKQIVKDIRDLAPNELDGVRAVVHLAGLSNDPLGDLSPALTQEINHVASVKLARFAKEREVERFIFASSCSVYGIAATDCALSETSPIRPVTEYAKSKALVERDVGAMADARFHPVFLRNATVYGPSSRLRLDLLVNNLLAWACVSGKIMVMSDGTPWRPLLHISDFCQAVLAVLEAPLSKVSNQIFNVGRNEDNLRVSEVAEIVRRTVPGTTVEILSRVSSDERTYRVNFDKITGALPHFKPVHTVHGGIEQLYRDYLRLGLVKEDLDAPRFFRVRWMKHLMATGRLNKELRWTTECEPA